jgi:tetratricopeptide (TPR) repeat protein
MGENEKAEPLLEAAVRANPNDENAQMALARVLIGLKKYDAATPYLRSYLDRNPKDTQAWYLLGKTYLQLSEDALGRINQIDPNSVTAHIVAGEIDESMKNYDGALVEYKKAIDLAPKQPGTHEHMGNAFWVTGTDGVQGGAPERSEQLHGALETGERDAGGECSGAGCADGSKSGGGAVPGADAGARGPRSRAGEAGQAGGGIA